MKASRLVDLVQGGRPARAAWKSLRAQVRDDLEPGLRRGRRWIAVEELVGHAIERPSSEEVDADLRAAAFLLKRLAKATDRPMARAACRGMAAALWIRVGSDDRARKHIDKSVALLQRTISADSRAMRGSRKPAKYHDLLYRRRYLGNEVMALRRFLDKEVEVAEPVKTPTLKSLRKKAVAHKPAIRRGRASVPTWDEIVFGLTHGDDASLRSQI
ncbi:MAG: hypothetical protein GC156_01230 [Actinomycetales bacterium]|nr:hypothetical protein [Actinomycetales bacterium]